MNYSTTPDFAQKLAVLARAADTRAEISRLISKIEAASDTASVLTSLQPNVHVLDGGIYVVRAGELRVFLSFGDDFVLLVDLATAPRSPAATGQVSPSNRPNPPGQNNTRLNPRLNGSVNPFVNGAINPRVNGAINPRVNGAINPRVNGAINPRVNGAINPRVNGAINPRVNGAINPRVNGAINPRFNGTINPRRNPTYPGPYLYDLSLNPSRYFVRANDAVDVIFDLQDEFCGTAVLASPSVRAMYDANQEWTGYLVSNGQSGFLHFNLDGEWVGFVV